MIKNDREWINTWSVMCEIVGKVGIEAPFICRPFSQTDLTQIKMGIPFMKIKNFSISIIAGF
jgi:hypothetical protein